MANQITLGATLLFDGGDGTGGAPDDLAGAPIGTADTSTFLQGSNSYTISASNSRVGMMFDAGSAQDYSSQTFYLTVNSGVVGLLDTKANGGFRMRFCGATVTDFFEVNIGGSDSWPSSIQGGWVTFAVDIETAKADAGRITGGTEPATNVIRYVGFSNLLTTMPKMADNTWFDTLYRLPDGTAGIIVEGRNAGTTDWTAADILTQLGTGQMFYFLSAANTYTLTAPVQFGINDTSTHGFSDTNQVWLWDNQEFIPDDVYSISALGNSGGTTNVAFGTKTGTGVNATGAQGFTIRSGSTGPRWDMDFDDPDLDSIDFYGCSFSHVGDWQLDDIAVESVSSLFIDTTGGEATNSDLFTQNSFINSNTAANASTLIWNENVDPDTILNGCSFEKGTNAHHAIEFGTAIASGANFTLTGCDFGTDFSATEEGTTGDETFHFLDTTGTITLSLVNCTGNFGYRTEGVAVSIVPDPVSLSVHVNDNTGADLPNARVYMEAADGTGDLPFEEAVTSIIRSGTLATVTHTAHGLVSGEYVNFNGITGDKTADNSGAHEVTVLTPTTYTYQTANAGDLSFSGTITATGAFFHGLTDGAGDLAHERVLTNSQPVRGFIRKSSSGNGISVDTYYFDGSDAAASDPGGVWTNETNADDGSTSTTASCVTLGSNASNFLKIEGTDAPASGETITQVRVRAFGSDGGVSTEEFEVYTDGLAETLCTANNTMPGGGADGWGTYTTLTAPTGGWTWAQIQALEVKHYLSAFTSGGVSVYRIEIEVTSGSAIIPRFKTFDLAGLTVNNSTGLAVNARLISDE